MKKDRRWLKSAIAASAEPMAAFPWDRGTVAPAANRRRSSPQCRKSRGRAPRADWAVTTAANHLSAIVGCKRRQTLNNPPRPAVIVRGFIFNLAKTLTGQPTSDILGPTDVPL